MVERTAFLVLVAGGDRKTAVQTIVFRALWSSHSQVIHNARTQTGHLNFLTKTKKDWTHALLLLFIGIHTSHIYPCIGVVGLCCEVFVRLEYCHECSRASMHLVLNACTHVIIEGSLEVKLSTIWTDGKAQPGRSSAMEKVRREKIRDETDQPWRKSEVRRSEMKKISQDEKVGKSRNTVFFYIVLWLRRVEK